MHSTHDQLRLVHELRTRQIAEATEHRLGRIARSDTDRGSIRRTVGRSLIRLGHALAAEPESTLQPARPR